MVLQHIQIKQKLKSSITIQSIHSGFELSVPFLMVGAAALLLLNLPFSAYSSFLEAFWNGMLKTILTDIYTYTLGAISIILCLTVSASYARLAGDAENHLYSAVALVSYMAFCSHALNQGSNIFDARWLFTSLCITQLSCFFFRLSHQHQSLTGRLYMPGAGYLFNMAMKNLLPIIIIVAGFTCMGHFLYLIFGQENIANFGSGLLLELFTNMPGGLLRTILYVLFIHIFWFFGIHGSNILEPVAKGIYEPLLAVNVELAAAGQAPTEIFSSGFLDTFAFMGGCGSTLCMAIALLLFSRKRYNRRLAMMVLPTTIFNTNEILLFGFPIVFNPQMLIPFLLTPVVQTCISAAAMTLGLVPLPCYPVNWTVPAIYSGYLITGSIAGSVLQLFNIIIGIAIYAPFARAYEEKQVVTYKKAAEQMEKDALYGDLHGKSPGLMKFSYPGYTYARTLASDFDDALEHNEIMLYYQPQMYAGSYIYGAEGLLRWQHPVIGFVSPLLILELAAERGKISELTYYLMERLCRDAKLMRPYLKTHMHLSLNLSADHVREEGFVSQVEEIFKDFPRTAITPVFEVTERTIMDFSDANFRKIKALKAKGVQFSIDDFGMGYNSITMLQEELFDEIKLDGSLIAQLQGNGRSREIVSKIIKLSDNLNYRVIAEGVETKEQRDELQELECRIFQGYYYSRPLPLAQLLKYLQELN